MVPERLAPILPLRFALKVAPAAPRKGLVFLTPPAARPRLAYRPVATVVFPAVKAVLPLFPMGAVAVGVGVALTVIAVAQVMPALPVAVAVVVAVAAVPVAMEWTLRAAPLVIISMVKEAAPPIPPVRWVVAVVVVIISPTPASAAMERLNGPPLNLALWPAPAGAVVGAAMPPPRPAVAAPAASTAGGGGGGGVGAGPGRKVVSGSILFPQWVSARQPSVLQ